VAGVVGILTAIGLVVAAPVILSMIGLQSSTDLLIRFGRWPLLAVLLLIGLAVLYRFAGGGFRSEAPLLPLHG
jgi:membrane protein